MMAVGAVVAEDTVKRQKINATDERMRLLTWPGK
jgi:hypothetical protein